MPALLHEAHEADLRPLSVLAARTFPLACPPELDAEVIEAFVAENLSEEAFSRHLEASDHAVLVAREGSGGADGVPEDGEIVGYVLLVDGIAMDPACEAQIVHRPTTGISKFYVHPGHHGGGIATRMLDDVIRRARRQGSRSLWLATNVANTRARRFYDKHGFSPRGHRTFDVGGVANTDVVYELTL